MATIKYLLQSNASNSSIYLRLSLDRTTSLKRRTGLFINPDDWSTATGLPKQNNPQNKKLSTDLKRLEAFVFDKINNTDNKAQTLTGDWLQFQIDLFFGNVSDTAQSNTVIEAIQNIIDTAHTRENGKNGIGLSKSRINSYSRLKSLFNDFQGIKNYKINQLDKKLFNAFRDWLIKKEYSQTYVNKNLSDLKGICNDAKGRGIEVSFDLDSIKYKKPTAYDDEMDVITLTETEIELIENLELTNERLINTRKWLLLSCYTGQRGTDLTERIKKENFHRYGSDLIIKIIQQKINKPVTIPVLPKVKEIYDQGLPYQISVQNLNKYFKELAKLAGIDTPTMGRLRDDGNRGIKKTRPKWQYISTHTGRRTFATLHYGKLPTPIIMRVTGHSKESTFLTYINQSNDDFIDTFIDYYKTKELKQQKKTQLTLIKEAN